MPQLNGIEAAIKMRENGSEAKVVFLTVNEDSDFVRAALRTGALGYVIKSRMASDLCTAINGAISGHLFVSPSCLFSVDPDQRNLLHSDARGKFFDLSIPCKRSCTDCLPSILLLVSLMLSIDTPTTQSGSESGMIAESSFLLCLG